MWQDFYDSFVLNFIKDDRWKYLTNGLAVTLKLTFFAVLLGLVIGFFIAMVRSTYENTGKLKILNAICGLYLTVIRGTPVVVQLLIIYFVIFGSWLSGSIPARIRRRSSGPASSPSPRGSSRPDGAWASTTARP